MELGEKTKNFKYLEREQKFTMVAFSESKWEIFQKYITLGVGASQGSLKFPCWIYMEFPYLSVKFPGRLENLYGILGEIPYFRYIL